ncbi:hypothetical protein [Arthrobacter sp. ISL-5]|uniref:hypothetical protein n=1 Tax=Arthrobacter sp. ISL-5 TaxID=2819111 RepID=UPI001BEA9E96|nr:hypothetical protein [Arthrobacter sp. ISL-5]MBT2551545.1 hypothetical protein [Arthrobacter sp. ISL-5]
MMSRKGMSRSRKIWLAVLAGAVALVTTFFLWASWKSDQIVTELKSIADRIQPEPAWESLDTQPPMAAALCIPLDGPCSQYSYRWDTHRKYGEGDLEKYIQQVSLSPREYKPCVRNPRFNAGGLDCRAIGVIDGWNVRITITDYGQEDDAHIVQIVVNKYGY